MGSTSTSDRIASLANFRQEFGFEPVEGRSQLRRAHRALERQIVADHLSVLWKDIAMCERQLLRRTPPKWLRNPNLPDERPIRAALAGLESRYARAQALARTFRLHPDQPFKLR